MPGQRHHFPSLIEVLKKARIPFSFAAELFHCISDDPDLCKNVTSVIAEDVVSVQGEVINSAKNLGWYINDPSLLQTAVDMMTLAPPKRITVEIREEVTPRLIKQLHSFLNSLRNRFCGSMNLLVPFSFFEFSPIDDAFEDLKDIRYVNHPQILNSVDKLY